MSTQRLKLKTLHPAPAGLRLGFTMTELILVITIIVVLLGLLLPVIGKVRAAGQRTRSEAVIRNIANAIGAYQMQFRAYPGVYANVDVARAGGAGTVTSSENLLLSLVGGMVSTSNPGVTPSVVVYQTNLLGTGPRNLLNNQGKQFPPFIEGAAWTDASTSGTGGHFKDGSDSLATDTDIPEFLDGYQANPLPVLYLRANIGKTGIASADLTTQYDASELYPYTQHLGSGSSHGLRNLGLDTDPLLSNAPNDAIPYLRSTTIPSGPRTPDSFILIGAGPDRLYGTADDITSFGSVIP